MKETYSSDINGSGTSASNRQISLDDLNRILDGIDIDDLKECVRDDDIDVERILAKYKARYQGTPESWELMYPFDIANLIRTWVSEDKNTQQQRQTDIEYIIARVT